MQSRRTVQHIHRRLQEMDKSLEAGLGPRNSQCVENMVADIKYLLSYVQRKLDEER